MITIYIKPNQFTKNVDENGNIFDFKFKTIEKEDGTTEIKDIYLENGFTKVELEDKYFDCEKADFDEDFKFNKTKYNNRKSMAENSLKIAELINKLKATDYQAIKFAEGQLTIDEFKPIKDQRQLWRNEINELQAQIGEK